MGKQEKPYLLVIDDEEAIGIIIDMNLGGKYQVVQKTDGNEALKWLKNGNFPDAIVADLNMPNLSGLEFITSVRKLTLYDDVPILVLSGEEESATRIECFEAGADDFIVKPFNPKELSLRIDRLFKWLDKTR